MRMNLCKIWSLFMVLVVLTVGCRFNTSNAKKVDRMLKTLKSTPIQFEENSFVICRNGVNDKTVSLDEAQFKMICFVDSQECSPCILKDAYLWNGYVNVFKSGEVAFLYVVSSKTVDAVRSQIRESGFSQNFYIDTLGKFKHENRQIPESSVYHTFLVDKDNNVLLVGNPAKNKHIEKLFFEIVNKELGTEYKPL